MIIQTSKLLSAFLDVAAVVVWFPYFLLFFTISVFLFCFFFVIFSKILRHFAYNQKQVLRIMVIGNTLSSLSLTSAFILFAVFPTIE